MILPFFKYHGAGNDFIIVDGRFKDYLKEINDLNNTIAFLCHRQFGIGADGLMVLQLDPEHDFKMRYFNSDGYEGSMCGNGGRCLVAFAHHVGLIDNEAAFMASDGLHKASILSHEHHQMIVALGMTDVAEIKTINEDYFLNTGSPHLVRFVEDLENLDVFTLGREIRNASPYKETGTNVNFAEIKDDAIYVRTYERGVENETLACGTGITAVAIAAHYKGFKKPKNRYPIKARGGDLEVKFDRDGDIYRHIILQGPATQVFKGEIIV